MANFQSKRVLNRGEIPRQACSHTRPFFHQRLEAHSVLWPQGFHVNSSCTFIAQAGTEGRMHPLYLLLHLPDLLLYLRYLVIYQLDLLCLVSLPLKKP